MHDERNIEYLNKRRILYRQDPVNDKCSVEYDWGYYFEDGTRECYTLFNSKARINTYKSLKWHLYVLWYLNHSMSEDQFETLARFICTRSNNFITFNVSEHALDNILYDVSMVDLEKPPPNKLRKIIFKDNTGLTTSEKLSIVGHIIGKSKKVNESDIYETMLYMHDISQKITIKNIAEHFKCTTRTIHRNMSNELKKEKELLNKNL